MGFASDGDRDVAFGPGRVPVEKARSDGAELADSLTMSSDQGESPPSSIDTGHVPPAQIVVPPVAPEPGPQNPPPAPAKFSFPTLLASVVLSIGAGALGAWAYDRFALKPKAEPPPKAEKSEPAPFPESAGTVLSGDVETLQKRVVRLEEGLAAIPKDQPLADVVVLKDRVNAIEKALGQEGFDKKVGAIEGRVEKADKGLGDLKSEIESLRQALDADHTALMAIRRPPPDLDAVRAEAVKPAVEDINVDGEALAEGAQLLEKKQYADAREIFRKMQENHPTDARVWYYSALATGFATGDWTGQAERLVDKGIEREKAGTPDKAAIDATFSSLSKEAGKDWLAAYRLRAK